MPLVSVSAVTYRRTTSPWPGGNGAVMASVDGALCDETKVSMACETRCNRRANRFNNLRRSAVRTAKARINRSNLDVVVVVVVVGRRSPSSSLRAPLMSFSSWMAVVAAAALDRDDMAATNAASPYSLAIVAFSADMDLCNLLKAANSTSFRCNDRRILVGFAGSYSTLSVLNVDCVGRSCSIDDDDDDEEEE